MKLFKTVCVAVPAALLSLNVSAANLVDSKVLPAWFQKSLQKDADVKTTGKLKIEALNVDATMKGKPEQQETEEGVWYYLIDVGGASPVECYAFTSFDGVANSLHSVVDFSLKGVEALNKKKLVNRFNYAIDVAVTGTTPYMRYDTLYMLGENDQKVIGMLKGASARTANTLEICLHNEAGYEKAFTGVFESFVQAFANANPSNTFFEPIYSMTINDIPVGFAQEMMSVDADGDVQSVTRTAMLMPVDASDVSRTDSEKTEWGRTDGSLINSYEYSVENGEIASEFTLQNIEGVWQVAGKIQGKEIKVNLNYDSWLLSDFGSYGQTAALLASEDNQIKANMWTSDTDPTAVTPVSLSKVADSEDANVELNMGPMSMRFLADKTGMFQNGSISQGGLTVKMKLISSHGTPTVP